MRVFESVLKAAADPSRARILKMLEGGELCVCQVMAVLKLSQSTTSKHLSVLRAAGLVEERKEGRWVYCRLAEEAVNPYALPTLALLREWLNDDASVRQDRERLRIVREMTVAQLCALPGLDLDACCSGLIPFPTRARRPSNA
ncbi:MAG TPA: metalloregulator ArsR/SmtB family transcription factor [Armatimonadota bacterium]|jgi:arsenate reductase/ArsR family transcriptional regulator